MNQDVSTVKELFDDRGSRVVHRSWVGGGDKCLGLELEVRYQCGMAVRSGEIG